MEAYIWRTTGGSKYACSYTGSDLYGTGTATNPFKTLTAAYWYGTAGGTIICRGIFNDNPTKAAWVTSIPYYGNNASIVGDYYGAAVWDGQNTEFLYGYFMARMIVLNSTSVGGFVGLGGASGADRVGGASVVCGLAGSPALIDNCVAYWGVLGGTSAVSGVVFSNMKRTATELLSLGMNSGNTLVNNTYHNALKVDTRRCFTYNRGIIGWSLFTQFCVYLDQPITIQYSLFNSECTFWYARGEVNGVAVVAGGTGYLANQILTLQGSEGGVNATVTVNTVDANGTILTLKAVTTKGTLNTYGVKSTTGGTGAGAQINVTALSNIVDAQFTPTGVDDTAKMQSIVNKTLTLGTSGTTFTSCKYTSQLASDIYNNLAKLDYTVKPASDASFTQSLAVDPSKYYYGALKPSINVPIITNSDGVAACWDSTTATGDIVVIDNTIRIDNASPYQQVSTILSKIVTLDPTTAVYDEIKAMHIPIFNQGYYLGDKNRILSTKIYAGTTLSVGRYIVRSAKIKYGIDDINIGDVVSVTSAGTTFSDINGNTGYLLEIRDPNVWNPVYVRMAPFAYGILSADTEGVGAALKAGVTYLNIGSENVTINPGLPSQRILVPHESFIAQIGNTWSARSEYQLGIIFDDDPIVGNRIVPSGEWIPAMNYTSFFNRKDGLNQLYSAQDDEVNGGKRLLGSGTPESYAISGGYNYTYIDKMYVQFKLILRTWDL